MGRMNCSLTFTIIREKAQCLASEPNIRVFLKDDIPIVWLVIGKEHSKRI